jgi:hypothetical protein
VSLQYPDWSQCCPNDVHRLLASLVKDRHDAEDEATRDRRRALRKAVLEQAVRATTQMNRPFQPRGSSFDNSDSEPSIYVPGKALPMAYAPEQVSTKVQRVHSM